MQNNLTHYVYYDKRSGDLLSIGNQPEAGYEAGFMVSFDEVESLISGKVRASDYRVGYKRTPDGKSSVSIIPKSDDGYSFNSKAFEWITPTDGEVEFEVTWDGSNKQWEFLVTDLVSDLDSMLVDKLIFFVTLESDFDFLIRTISVSINDLKHGAVVVPFESTLESKINKVSISSRLIFKNYNLRIVNE